MSFSSHDRSPDVAVGGCYESEEHGDLYDQIGAGEDFVGFREFRGFGFVVQIPSHV